MTSELDGIKARTAERDEQRRTNVASLGLEGMDRLAAEDRADLDRAIAIAEKWEAQCQERDEARARVAWYERGDQAEVDGYNAAEDGVQKEANPYSKPQQLDDDRRYYDWLDGWERGNTEQELEKARAAALALRERVKLMPQNSYVKEVLADTEWLEQHHPSDT